MLEPFKIDYSQLLALPVFQQSWSKPQDFLNELSYDWIDAYKRQCSRETQVTEITSGPMRFLFDLEGSDMGDGAHPQGVIARVVAAYGVSAPTKQSRAKQDARLRGWMGTRGQKLEPGRDKGHFIGHALGGGVDGIEVNVFEQRRDLNRGWSPEGKRFREMERFCASQPGVVFFHRPIYLSETDVPDLLEFGIFRSASDIWVEIFDNRLTT